MNAQLDVREEDLPGSLAEIARVIGVSATLKLIERFGGTRLYVPGAKRLTEDHVIARTIGLAAARAIVKIWGEDRLEIPRAARALRLARNRAVRRESSTLSVPKLALKWGLTERQIYQIRRLPVAASRGSGAQRERLTGRGRIR